MNLDRIWAYWPMGQMVVEGKLYTLTDCPGQVDTVVLAFADLDGQRGVSTWALTKVATQQSLISMIRKLQRGGRRVTIGIRATKEQPWESFDPARVARTVVREFIADWGFDGVHLHQPLITSRTGPRLFDALRRVRDAVGPERELTVLLPKTRGEVQEFLGHAASVLSMAATSGFGRQLNHRLHAFGRCSRHLGPERVALGIRPGAVTDRRSTDKRLIKKLAAYRPVGSQKAGTLIDHLGRDRKSRTGRSDFAVLRDVDVGRLQAREQAEAEAIRERMGPTPTDHPKRKGR